MLPLEFNEYFSPLVYEFTYRSVCRKRATSRLSLAGLTVNRHLLCAKALLVLEFTEMAYNSRWEEKMPSLKS